MIQFNLLPDVKLKYLQVRRTRRIIVVVASLVGGVSLLVTIILFSLVRGIQIQHIKNLSVRIEEDSKQLQGINDLDRILTVQNQLAHLPVLHQKTPAVDRLRGYLAQVTPEGVTYAKIDVDMAASKMSFSGTADSLLKVNQYVDTLKFTKYKTGNTEGAAFSNVVLATFGRDGTSASYQINFDFNPIIFDNTKTEADGNQITLVVPQIVTTRSVQYAPFVDPLNRAATEEPPDTNDEVGP